MRETTTFAQIRAEYEIKKASTSPEEFEAHCDQEDVDFEANHGSQAFADTSTKQMVAVATMSLEVIEQEEENEQDFLRSFFDLATEVSNSEEY